MMKMKRIQQEVEQQQELSDIANNKKNGIHRRRNLANIQHQQYGSEDEGLQQKLQLRNHRHHYERPESVKYKKPNIHRNTRDADKSSIISKILASLFLCVIFFLLYLQNQKRRQQRQRRRVEKQLDPVRRNRLISAMIATSVSTKCILDLYFYFLSCFSTFSRHLGPNKSCNFSCNGME